MPQVIKLLLPLLLAMVSTLVQAEEPTCLAKQTPDNPKCDKHFVANPDCGLETWFWALQPVCIAAVYLAVIAKKKWMHGWHGRPNERNVVWALDAAKQAASAATVQIGAGFGANYLYALDQKDPESNTTDECSWYVLVFALNASLGVLAAYVLLFVVCKHQRSGRYSTDTSGVSYGTWAKQLLLWVLVSAAARGVVFLLFWWSASSTDKPLQMFVATLAQAFACEPGDFETMVLLGCPLLLNIGMACVQDSMLRDKRPPTKQISGAMGAALGSGAGDGLGVGLLAFSTESPPEPGPSTAAVGGGEEDEEYEKVDPPVVEKSYKAKQKACMKGCCSCLILSVLLVLWTGVLFKIHNSQQVFDPCYIQVRAEYPHDYLVPQPEHPNCKASQPIKDQKTHQLQTFKSMIEHRHGTCRQQRFFSRRFSSESRSFARTGSGQTDRNLKNRGAFPFCADLVNKSAGDGRWKSMCKCCNARQASNLTIPCTPRQGESGAMDCPGLGTCCARSTLHNPMPDLIENCSICTKYKPCDQHRCPARPDNIRNSQHIPMLLGVLMSFMGNCHVIFSFSFDKALQQRTITALLACAAAVELVYCIGFMLQELAFRIPNETCVLSDGKSGVDGAYSYRRQQKQLAFLFCVYAAMSKF
jgi:hypothetical protein